MYVKLVGPDYTTIYECGSATWTETGADSSEFGREMRVDMEGGPCASVQYGEKAATAYIVGDSGRTVERITFRERGTPI